MYKRIVLILSAMVVFFAIGCDNQSTKAHIDKEMISPGDKEDEEIITPKEIIPPKIESDTKEAKDFLALLEGKTKTENDDSKIFRYEIRDGGKTLIEIRKADNQTHIEYNFQSAKSGTIAYYTEKWTTKLLDPSLPEIPIYYQYVAFEIKDGKLILYPYYNNQKEMDKYYMDMFYPNDAGHPDYSKPKIHIYKMDFSEAIGQKNNIDFTFYQPIGKLQ